jgi:O-antigen ligase
MLMVTPVAFGLFARAFRRYRARVGQRANARRWLVTLASPEGLATMYAVVPALAAVGSLLATTSRGAIIAFGGGLSLAALALWRRRAVPAWAFAAVFTLVALSWFGTDRIETRLRMVSQDAPGRTVVWQDTLDRMGGRWIGGSGFNTFDVAMYRASAWALPVGASPWSDPYETTIVNVTRVGFRTPEAIPGLWWYREAHNDYVQLLTETGAVGLLLALWAAVSVLGALRGDPWLLAAAAGVFMHEFVDFGLHLPAIVALFVALSAIKPHSSPA